MDLSLRILICFFSVLVLSSCGGGSGGDSSVRDVPEPPMVVADPILNISPGGIWVTQNLIGDPSLKVYISENGKLMLDRANLIFDEGLVVQEGSFVRWGDGQISFAGESEIRGVYQSSQITIGALVFRPDVANCELTGTLIERVSLNVSLSCTDASNLTEVEMLNLVPAPDCSSIPFVTCISSESYDVSSSLDLIAGSYSYESLGTPSQISISPLGQISGVFDNGIECDVRGSVSIINENFNLYDLEWAFSNCVPNISGQNGRQFEGFLFVRGDGSFIPKRVGFIVSSLDGVSPDFLVGTYSEIL